MFMQMTKLNTTISFDLKVGWMSLCFFHYPPEAFLLSKRKPSSGGKKEKNGGKQNERNERNG